MLDPTEALRDERELPRQEPVALAQEPVPVRAEESAPVRQPGRVRAWFGDVWQRLNEPTQRTPAEYRGRRLPRIVNDLLDGKGIQGAAHQAMLGESVGLVVDHALASRDGAQTPMNHLVGATGEYVWTVWDNAKPLEERRAP